ncbi:MAG: aldehyde dehydrogenase family protein, partial [Chloroflexota bacterium]
MTTIKEIFETMEYGTAPESAATANAWLDDHGSPDGDLGPNGTLGRAFSLFINGKFIQPKGAKMMEVIAPATGETLAHVVDGTADDVAAAFAAAVKAQKKWAKTSDHERAKVLYAIARGIQKHDRLLAVVEALDNGKSIRETRDIDVPLVARHFYHHAGWAQLMSRELPNHEPVGVVGQIIPWNFPLLMLAWKVAPALAMGNAVVLKPAPSTPLTALLFAEIAAEAGLPAGLLNIVTGGDEAG